MIEKLLKCFKLITFDDKVFTNVRPSTIAPVFKNVELRVDATRTISPIPPPIEISSQLLSYKPCIHIDMDFSGGDRIYFWKIITQIPNESRSWITLISPTLSISSMWS